MFCLMVLFQDRGVKILRRRKNTANYHTSRILHCPDFGRT